MWSLLGVALALVFAGVAWWRSRAASGYYDREIYAMTASVHRRYALVALAFAALFAGIRFTDWQALLVPCFAAFTLLAVFYATSFLRGFSNDDD